MRPPPAASMCRQVATAFRFAKAAAAKVDGNFVFSPVSINSALSLLAAGAKGKTLDQLLSHLGVGSRGAPGIAELNDLYSQSFVPLMADGSKLGGPRLSFVNGLFCDSSSPLKASYKGLVHDVYRAEARVLNFQQKAVEATKMINSWVEQNTNGLIKDLISQGSINSYTRLVLANALHFDGTWRKTFEPSLTRHSDFHLLNGSSVQVPFMNSSDKHCMASYDGFKVLVLPYWGDRGTRIFSMRIFLPDAKDGVWDLQEQLMSEPEFLNRHVPYELVQMKKLMLPKFKTKSNLEASTVLKGLGLELPFSPSDDLSDLADLCDAEKLFVTSLFHKCFVDVHERGTRAAAATALFGGGCARYQPPPKLQEFVADHPFIFMICEETSGSVLFMGHILNPSS